MDNQPITPHAGPTLDAEGNLTYIGEDGRRYVVAPPPELPPEPRGAEGEGEPPVER
jgi:hypothetical protein